MTEFEEQRYDRELRKFMAALRPPVHLRHQLDFGYRLDNQGVELYRICPSEPDSAAKHEVPFAKATYVKSEKIWNVYCRGRGADWHPYEAVPRVHYLEEFLSLVSEDVNGCFLP